MLYIHIYLIYFENEGDYMKNKNVIIQTEDLKQPWLNSPEIFEINRLAAKNFSVSYDTKEEALQYRPYSSQRVQLLNGTWKFQLVNKPSERLKGFEAIDVDHSKWVDIQVPGHWQLQGYDYPQYTNRIYPWIGNEEVNEGTAPVEYNPVGAYVTYFDLPRNFVGQPVYISLQGVESAFYIYVNGECIGYSEDSFTNADFDLTPYLKEKNNKLALEVFRWCDASWIEDQDFWRLSGIFRDVFLYTNKDLSINEFQVLGNLNEDLSQGELVINGSLEHYGLRDESRCRLSGTLYDGDQIVSEVEIFNGLVQDLMAFETKVIYVKEPKLWSVEAPNLYI